MDTKTKENNAPQPNSDKNTEMDYSLGEHDTLYLNSLLSSINKENAHEEVDTGKAVGQEAL